MGHGYMPRWGDLAVSTKSGLGARVRSSQVQSCGQPHTTFALCLSWKFLGTPAKSWHRLKTNISPYPPGLKGYTGGPQAQEGRKMRKVGELMGLPAEQH